MKWFNSRQPLPALSREDALNHVPLKNPQVRESRLPSGVVLLTYAYRMRPFMAALSRRIGGPGSATAQRKLQLDTLGTQVWDLIDGRRPVGGLVRRFAEDHRVSAREAEIAVTQFLRELGKRGVIGLR